MALVRRMGVDRPAMAVEVIERKIPVAANLRGTSGSRSRCQAVWSRGKNLEKRGFPDTDEQKCAEK